MKRSTDERLGALFAKVSHLPEFLGIEMSDINTCGHTGDNALHVVAQWGDLASAKLLIERGIDVNKPGGSWIYASTRCE